jgi:hypothetical protein
MEGGFPLVNLRSDQRYNALLHVLVLLCLLLLGSIRIRTRLVSVLLYSSGMLLCITTSSPTGGEKQAGKMVQSTLEVFLKKRPPPFSPWLSIFLVERRLPRRRQAISLIIVCLFS